MEEQPVSNGVENEELEEDGKLPLETVDLTGEANEPMQPTLEFVQQTSQEEEGSQVFTPTASSFTTTIEGTEQQSTRTKTRSGSQSLKEWGSHQLKLTKQLVQERFGHGIRTVDSDLEHRIEGLRETQKKYSQLLSLFSQFQAQFKLVVETQKTLAEHFAFMSIRSPELHMEFHLNAETQKIISRNGETLLEAAKHFMSNVQTVSSRTMEDTLVTAKGYDQARLSFDAYRTECENLQKQAATSPRAASSLVTVSAEMEKHKKKFEQLRNDVDIKLKLLDENKLKVTHKQMVLLQAAFAAYFSCNHEALDALLVQFKDKLEECEEKNEPPAWLEDLPSQQDQSQ